MSTRFITAHMKLIAAFAIAAAAIVSLTMAMPTYAAASTGDDSSHSSWNDDNQNDWDNTSDKNWNDNNNWNSGHGLLSIAGSLAINWQDMGWKDSSGKDWWQDCSQNMWDTHKGDWWKGNNMTWDQWSKWCNDTQNSHMQNGSNQNNNWNKDDNRNKDNNRNENDSWSKDNHDDSNKDWNNNDEWNKDRNSNDNNCEQDDNRSKDDKNSGDGNDW